MNTHFYLTLIAIGLLSSAWCFGFHAFVGKVIFAEVIGFDLDERWDDLKRGYKLLFKPLFACPYCMASVHGSAIYFLFLFTMLGWMYWIPFCICLCGLNYVITQFFTE